jgi:uncharacterized phage protein (TIGR01671 family)
MREIKFRAWDKEAKVMHEWNNQFFSDTSPVTGYSSDFPTGEDMILMQFTGLHDKNGKEIYEGDVLKCGRYVLGRGPADKGYRNRVVNWSGTRGSWILDDDDGWNASIYSNIEVVGNFYENPELL